MFQKGRLAMSNLARIEIECDVADAAARRAAEEGMSVTAYISPLLQRSFERAPGEESVLAYDHLHGSGEIQIDREPWRERREPQATLRAV
jgi:hypothetical protein